MWNTGRRECIFYLKNVFNYIKTTSAWKKGGGEEGDSDTKKFRQPSSRDIFPNFESCSSSI